MSFQANAWQAQFVPGLHMVQSPLTPHPVSLISFSHWGTSDSDSVLSALQDKVAERIILLEGWRRSLVALLAGALSALSLAPYHISPILFLTVPVLVWLMDGAVPPAGSRPVIGFVRRIWPAFKIGWLFGFGFFLASFWWVGKAFLVDADEFIYLLPFAVLALPAGLALFWGVATALARLAWTDNTPRHGWVRLLALATAFALMEWLRGTVLTGLPWNNIAYGAMPTTLFMQTSAYIGLYGMTWLTMLCAATLLPALAENRRLLIIPIALLAIHAGLGVHRLSQATDDTVADIRLRLVQPAIDQSDKWEPENEAAIMESYLGLSNTNRGPEAASAGAFTHIIWPESAFPFILTERREQLAAIAALLPPKTSLITGAMRLEKGTDTSRPRVFNSLLVLDGNGEIVHARDKTRLLPFGEFLPFQQTLENLGLRQLTQLRGGFEQGRRRRSVVTQTAPPFLPLICYEIVFSGKVRSSWDGAGQQPKWIVNLTNDAWFGFTAGPYQHAHQAQVRAVEEGLPVVRAANNGISMVVDAYGRVTESLALGEKGVVDADLPVAAPTTFFSRTGNLPFIIFVCLLMGILVVVRASNTNRL